MIEHFFLDGYGGITDELADANDMQSLLKRVNEAYFGKKVL